MAAGRLLRLPTLAVCLSVIALAACPPATSAGEVTLPEREYAVHLLALMNAEREAAGLPDLTLCFDRSEVASWRSYDMASRNYFAHFNPEGVGAEQLLRAYPIDFALLGENIARSTYPAEEVVGVVHRALMASEGHRDNVLDARFGQVGIAVSQTGAMYYFAIVFTD